LLSSMNSAEAAFAPMVASTFSYSGVANGMYIGKAVWEQKSSSPTLDTKEGLRSDQQPWRFFDEISSFNTSTLMLCSDTRLTNTTSMDNYVRITGDSAGVDSNGQGVLFVALVALTW